MNEHCTPTLATHDDLQLDTQIMDEDDLKWMTRFYMEVSVWLNEGLHGLKRRFECNGVCQFGLRSGYKTNRDIIQMILGSFE